MPLNLWTRFIDYAAYLGCDADDTGEIRLQKTLLVAMSLMIATAAFLWGTIYLFFREPFPVLIGWGSAVFFGLNLVIFRARRNFAAFRLSGYLGIVFLPFFMCLALGGFALSSAVILWSLLGPIEAIILRQPRAAVRLFGLYLVLVLVCALLQPVLRGENNLSPPALLAFFVMNIGAVSAISFVVLLEMFARERRLEQEVQELRIVIDEVKKQEQIDQIVDSEYFQDLLTKAKKARGQDGAAQPSESPLPRATE